MARILVIDDNEDIRMVVADVLEAAGHEVAQAADGASGIQLQRTRPAAVVVTDIVMPEKEGIETIRDLRAEFPDLKIIAMSGALKSSTHLYMARELGAHKVLHKPFGPGILVEYVNALLRAPAG
ncbi:response regulator transcription factor [Usitatibacter palustris]|uniref:Chemotaxis protein CheY n=1 Tax=Usitatibacter palustris TaxID=2732487 RepID=A0A6M4H571_9PROT|nr:response regulator [Usitatibacter palustris]QJR14305.1 Chemotaxis protein CheY [Usitatibacter palustris]